MLTTTALRQAFTCLNKKIPHCSSEGDWSASSPHVTYSEGGRFLKVSFARSPGMEWNQEHFYNHDRESKRGTCKGFSFGSRRRMLDRLNQVLVAAELPDFVTLTLPDNCFDDSVTRFAKTAKLHLDVFLKRLSRACPSACGFWRIEWKARKSGEHEGKLFPHFHLLMWGVPTRSTGMWLNKYDNDVTERFESFIPVRDCQQSFAAFCDDVVHNHTFKTFRSGSRFCERRHAHKMRIEDAAHLEEKFGVEKTFMSFFDWISLNWYHVVGTGNLDHFLAGCRVEKIRSWGGVMSYCAKYMSKADSENFMANIETGRSWGIFNRVNMPWAKLIDFDLDDDAGIRLRRIARRYLEKRIGHRVQRHYGFTLYCDVAQWKRLVELSPPVHPF